MVGDDESAKPGVEMVTYAGCVKTPVEVLVPVITTWKLAGVGPVIEMVKVDEPEPVTVVGLRLAVTPEEGPTTTADSATVPAKPLPDLSWIAVVPLPSVAISTVAGVADRA